MSLGKVALFFCNCFVGMVLRAFFTFFVLVLNLLVVFFRFTGGVLVWFRNRFLGFGVFNGFACWY